MSTFNQRIDLGHVDVSRLTSDEDFHREARRLVPKVLVQIGEAAGQNSMARTPAWLQGPSWLQAQLLVERQTLLHSRGG